MIANESVLISIEQLLKFAQSNLFLTDIDVDNARNNLLDMLKLPCPTTENVSYTKDIQLVMDNIVNYAIEQDIINQDNFILFETKVFGAVIPSPSTIDMLFSIKKQESGIKQACNWFFKFCKDCNYIRMQDIRKNIMWKHSGTHGNLVITINLSKPEKDAKQIAEALKAKTGYPACMLCPTNVGFAGNAGHPARQTLRIIPIDLNKEKWYIQFSPYQYYDQHLIALCSDHRPMVVDKNCLARLLDFVNLFPHYFMGSNAALPIVGGSILTHDHYQGGGKGLPMFTAQIRKSYKSCYSGVKIYSLDWYNSVVRVEGKNKNKVLDAASDILTRWSTYSDESSNIICKTTAQHNAVTPIARMEDGQFIIDMILRNNRTDETHPFGIYHPTEDLHNIKKEGIGIIEVMGTFILPGRLENELEKVKEYLKGEIPFDRETVKVGSLSSHAEMIEHLISVNGTKNNQSKADNIVKSYINHACEQILECTAVFKNTKEGQIAFEKFMVEGLNCEPIISKN